MGVYGGAVHVIIPAGPMVPGAELLKVLAQFVDVICVIVAEM